MRVIEQNRCAAWRASIVVVVILLLLVGGQDALARCTFNGNTTDATFVLLATMTVSRTATVGTVLYTSPNLVTQPQGVAGTCDANGAHTIAGYLDTTMPAVNGMTRVYQTNIPGIGIRVLEITNSGVTGGPHRSNITLEANAWQHQWTLPRNSAVGAWNTFRVELIVTGPVSPGTLSLPSPLAGMYSSDSTTARVNEVLYARLLTNGTTQIIVPSCTVGNNAIAVTLPTISSSNLNSVNATAGTVPFTIALTCNPSTRVAYQFEGTSPAGVAANRGILANRTNTGDATGVGVQILAGQGGVTAPVTLNTFSAPFITTTSANQPVSIPFVARYVRTGATMTVGAVWARATFTMDYQ